MTGPSVSIVVNTWNRAAHLRRLLPSLAHLEYDALEVVLVVGPCSDDTNDVVAPYRDVVKLVSCPLTRMCTSRNLGLDAAAGDVVVFIDDDGLPGDRGWVGALVAPFASDPGIGAAGGPVLDGDSESFQFRAGSVSRDGEHVFVTTPEDPRRTRPGWLPRPMGTNAAYRRAALLEIGGFDERIVYYGDECDISVRLANRGYRFAWVDTATVRHYPAPSPHRQLVERTRTVAHDDTYFCLRHSAAPRGLRLGRVLRRLPGKHYVREVLTARRHGRISAREFASFLMQMTLGVALAAVRSLSPPPTAPRRAPSSAFLPFSRPRPHRRLSIGLAARQLVPDGPCEGPARYTFDLADALHTLGHDVHVFGESPVQRRHLRLGFSVHGVTPGTSRRCLFPRHPILNGNLAHALAVADRLQELLDAGTPVDVFHATNWNFEGLGVLVDGTVPVVLMLVTSLSEVVEFEQWAVNDDLDAGMWLDRAQMRHAAVLCAPSRGLVAKYCERGLLDHETRDRVVVTPLGVVPQSTSPRPRPARRLLFVGTHVRRKGLDDLLAVLPALLTDHTDWCCDIVGDDTRTASNGTTLKAAFLDEHAGCPWLDRVLFHGKVSDDCLRARYAEAAIYVVPSRFESFGLTYLEAMRFGVPAVATRVGGIPEVVEDGVTGVLVPPGDRAALASTLARLMTDEAERERLGRAARDHVHLHATHLHMAKRLLPLYDSARQQSGGEPNASRRPRGSVVVDWIEDAGAPAGLVERLRRSMIVETTHDERRRLVAAATGRLPATAVYVEAIEACLSNGDAARAVRLAGDARRFAPDLDTSALDDLDAVERVARRLVNQPDTAALQGPRRRAAASMGPDSRLDAGLRLLREGRTPLAMAELFDVVDDLSLPVPVRLSARYHLASALKRCGFIDHASKEFERLRVAPHFSSLSADLRSAAWFHLGEIALAAGQPAEAADAFACCLTANPAHGRAAARLDELGRAGAATGSHP